VIYKRDGFSVDLETVVRIYPAVLVEHEGESSEMSLEWVDVYGSKVKILSFVLVFDNTKQGDEERHKQELHFDSKEELLEAMSEVATFF